MKIRSIVLLALAATSWTFEGYSVPSPSLINHVVVDDTVMKFRGLDHNIKDIVLGMVQTIKEYKLRCRVVDFGAENAIIDENLEQLVKLLRRLQNMQVLSLAQNRITDEGLKHLYPLLGHASLRYIVLTLNSFSPGGIRDCMT